jgi:hypothetical protein
MTVKSTSVGHCEPGDCACLTKSTNKTTPLPAPPLKSSLSGKNRSSVGMPVVCACCAKAAEPKPAAPSSAAITPAMVAQSSEPKRPRFRMASLL